MNEPKEHYHELLAGVIEHVLRCKEGPIRVPDLATFAGFSRFHLARLFREVSMETLESFLRRVRLERAAYHLHHSEGTLLEIGVDSGYSSAEAFSRAFRAAYGVLPSQFRTDSARAWKLSSPSDLHWNEHWTADDDPRVIGSEIVLRPARQLAVWRAIGNYSKLAEKWQAFRDQFACTIPEGRRFITIYLDNMWTHPTTRTMRADIGWELRTGDRIPQGMRPFTIPAGPYATTCRFIQRHERNDAWSYMSGKYSVHGSIGFDEYEAWPLPFDEVVTRIWVALPPR